MRKALLYFHTIRYLKLKQILYQLYYRFSQAKVGRVPNLDLRHWRESWNAPLIEKKMWNGENKFQFLNQNSAVELSGSWKTEGCSKLWRYNLHYLDCLNASDCALYKQKLDALVLSWISENQNLRGEGWEPYCLSLRIVNLIKWASREHHTNEILIKSIVKQVLVLEKRVEHHILANHLFANAKALIFAGVYFKGELANRWLIAGLKILDVEIREQFLDDGAHYELSPMYQAIVMWDLCDLINLAQRSQHSLLLVRGETLRETLNKGLEWLKSMCHPDGGLSFFNDSVLGGAPTFKELEHYARTLGGAYSKYNHTVHHHIDSGYVVVNLKNKGKAILDLSEVKSSYQPGHTHASSLSFELSLFGQRVFVNSGTSTYTPSSLRLFQRSTKSHNTISIDNKNSSNVWSSFRVANRARVNEVEISREEETVVVSASHSGFNKLLGGALHSRTFKFKQNVFSIVDKLSGNFTEATAYFYLHPELRVHKQNNQSFSLVLKNGEQVEVSFSQPAVLEDSFWYPEFGKSISNKVFIIEMLTPDLETTIVY